MTAGDRREERPTGSAGTDRDRIGAETFGPVGADGRAFVTADARRLHALDAATGERPWRECIAGGASTVYLYAGGVTVHASADGRTHVARYTHESRRAWRLRHGGDITGLVAADDVAYLATRDGYLLALAV